MRAICPDEIREYDELEYDISALAEQAMNKINAELCRHFRLEFPSKSVEIEVWSGLPEATQEGDGVFGVKYKEAQNRLHQAYETAGWLVVQKDGGCRVGRSLVTYSPSLVFYKLPD